MTSLALDGEHTAVAGRKVPVVRARGALVWSEHCYLLCIAVALLLAVAPPNLAIPGSRVLRHLPLLATLPLVLLSALGRRLSAPLTAVIPWHAALWVLAPLLILGLWIVVGSLHARFVEHWQSTFFNLGAYIMAAGAAALMMAHSQAPALLARAYLRLLVVAALVMAGGLAAAFGRTEIYHEEIFLCIPIAVVCATLRNRFHAWCGSLFFLGLALLSQKNTSYLIALMTALYIAYFFWLNPVERTSSAKRLWAHYLAFVCLVTLAGVGCYVIYFREQYLPSGNIEFRSFTYRAAWQQFLESPLWGSSFNVESIRKFTLYSIGIARNRLPTHSDIMDLLANGGIIALTLWIVGYLRVGWFAYRRILASRFFHYPWSGHAHAFAMISVAAVATYAFNPILLQPELAFLTWTTLGFLVGLAAIDPTAAGRQAASPPARGAVRVRQEGIQRQYASVASARIDHSGTRS